jgi:methionine aminopeptidase
MITGQTGNFIEKQVHKFIVQRKGYPSARGYMGFPKSLLISINDGIFFPCRTVVSYFLQC